MVITIDKLSQEAIYLQIRRQIIAAIAKGELAAGDLLPSVRALGSDLGVNLHTVNKAYAVLQDEGYVLMNGRKGTMVAERSQEQDPERLQDAERRTLDELTCLAAEFMARGGSADAFVKLATRAANGMEE